MAPCGHGLRQATALRASKHRAQEWSRCRPTGQQGQRAQPHGCQPADSCSSRNNRKESQMQTPTKLSAIALSGLLLLAACEQKQPASLDTRAGASGNVVTQGAAGDASVPPAGSVFSTVQGGSQAAPGATPTPAPASTRSNSKMSRAEESAAMPMAGQNNDHSAPTAASAPASSTGGAPARPRQ